MQFIYSISELIPYINWIYFHYAWSVPMGSREAVQLETDARRLLAHITPYTTVRAVVELFDCNSEGDDILIYPRERKLICASEVCAEEMSRRLVRLPMLRQQRAGKDGFCLCMADFLRPAVSGRRDRIGVFATTVSAEPHSVSPVSRNLSFSPLTPTVDDYRRLLLQTVSDRLAEAAAELLHLQVRRRIWGYAPNENLSMEDLHAERFQGIRPAVGYPSLPDVSLNFLLEELVHFSSIGIRLTEHAMMQPHASVSGLMIALPQAHYFSVGQISEAQFQDYAHRRGVSAEVLRPYLAGNIT